jgi:hypothetical protein
MEQPTMPAPMITTRGVDATVAALIASGPTGRRTSGPRHDDGGGPSATPPSWLDQDQDAAAIVIVCSEEVRNAFGDLLAQETRANLAGWATAEAHAAPAELLAVVSPVLEGWRAKREAEVLARWREEAGRDGRATAGWGPTLEAASDSRVDVLLFQEGANRPGYECPVCGRASIEPGARSDERRVGKAGPSKKKARLWAHQ